MKAARYVIAATVVASSCVTGGSRSPAPPARANEVIRFSGYNWTVKSSTGRVGPGPNFFSNGPANVWIDSAGLHLATSLENGRWTSSEVYLPRSLGYGEYTFQLAGRLDMLDSNAVFSPFLYETTSRELDIEFSRTLAAPTSAQFVVQPYTHVGNRTVFPMSQEEKSTHRIVWRADRVEFLSWNGWGAPTPANTLSSRTYSGPDNPPPGNERVHINLWLFDGKPPYSGRRDHVVVKSFVFRR